MPTTTLERLPNTVTGCHALIRALQNHVSDHDIEAERDELKERLEATEKENKELQAELDRLEEYIDDNPDSTDSINAFLDECVRVGPLRYDVPQTDRALRAIINLHDCVGRNP